MPCHHPTKRPNLPSTSRRRPTHESDLDLVLPDARQLIHANPSAPAATCAAARTLLARYTTLEAMLNDISH
ncbi:MAG: hypothetical protein FJ399_21580 [Verrucomicrobia bacterium]|nr:hypothetical protein [Verrucomicrobiota bacterium]